MPVSDKFVGALVGALIRENLPSGLAEYAGMEGKVVTVIITQCERLPSHLRFGVRAGTLVLRVHALVSCFRPYHRVSSFRQSRFLRAWSRSRLQPVRQLISFYRSLAMFAWFGLLEEGKISR